MRKVLVVFTALMAMMALTTVLADDKGRGNKGRGGGGRDRERVRSNDRRGQKDKDWVREPRMDGRHQDQSNDHHQDRDRHRDNSRRHHYPSHWGDNSRWSLYAGTGGFGFYLGPSYRGCRTEYYPVAPWRPVHYSSWENYYYFYSSNSCPIHGFIHTGYCQYYYDDSGGVEVYYFR